MQFYLKFSGIFLGISSANWTGFFFLIFLKEFLGIYFRSFTRNFLRNSSANSFRNSSENYLCNFSVVFARNSSGKLLEFLMKSFNNSYKYFKTNKNFIWNSPAFFQDFLRKLSSFLKNSQVFFLFPSIILSKMPLVIYSIFFRNSCENSSGNSFMNFPDNLFRNLGLRIFLRFLQ